MDLHGQIMNLQSDNKPSIPLCGGSPELREVLAYKLGHRDARHAAAELALGADAKIDALAEVVIDILSGLSDRDIEAMTGYGKRDCDRISKVKAWAIEHQRARAALVAG